ncbi:MAG TPA: hypothetical protein PLE30_03265 [Candidatus Kapabacteria bacterium]|nr:hypothetical protein [Candidatus Kapabacteria bacterium]
MKTYIYIIMVLLSSTSLLFANSHSELITMKENYIKSLEFIGASNYYYLNTGLLYADGTFQINQLNYINGNNFRQLEFDGVKINSLFDKSIDYSQIFYDDIFNLKDNLKVLNKKLNIDDTTNIKFELGAGSNIADANLLYYGQSGNFRWKTRNNYYVTNGYNNPNGVEEDILAKISQQAFQSSIGFSILDSKSIVEYNQLIMMNKSNNKYNKLVYDFNEINNLNTLFSLKYRSINSELISTNGQVYFKYINRNIDYPSYKLLSKENDISYGISLGVDFNLLEKATKLQLKYASEQMRATTFNKQYSLRLEQLDFFINQDFNLYSNNHTHLKLGLNYYNPIDDTKKIEYKGLLKYNLEFGFHHTFIFQNQINDIYARISFKNESSNFNYLFAKTLYSDTLIEDINYLNTYTLGYKIMATDDAYLDVYLGLFDYNDQLNFNDNKYPTKRAGLISLDINYRFYFLNLSIYARSFISDTYISYDTLLLQLPSRTLEYKLYIELFKNTLILLSLKNYKFREEFKDIRRTQYQSEVYLLNINLEQPISKNFKLFIIGENILDNKIPVYPYYFQPGINFHGGISATF